MGLPRKVGAKGEVRFSQKDRRGPQNVKQMGGKREEAKEGWGLTGAKSAIEGTGGRAGGGRGGKER